MLRSIETVNTDLELRVLREHLAEVQARVERLEREIEEEWIPGFDDRLRALEARLLASPGAPAGEAKAAP